MTAEEVKKSFEDLKSEGMDDNAILVALGQMFQKGDITKDQLEALIHQLGYEFTEDFAGKSEEEAKQSVLSEEESESESESEPEEEEEEEENESEESDEEEDDEDERKKAMSLFGRD